MQIQMWGGWAIVIKIQMWGGTYSLADMGGPIVMQIQMQGSYIHADMGGGDLQ